MQDRLVDVFVFVGMGLLVGAVWFKVYVEPRDEFVQLVGDCMTGKNDRSIESYRDCVDETAPNR